MRVLVGGVFCQRCQPAERFSRVATILRAGQRDFAARQCVDQISHFGRSQVFVIIFTDLGHGRVRTGAEAFDFFP